MINFHARIKKPIVFFDETKTMAPHWIESYASLNNECIIGNDALIWCKKGKVHRENDMPAIMAYDGRKIWVQYNKLHRENDKPAVITQDNTRLWYQNDILHRIGKPAIEYENGVGIWYEYGQQINAITRQLVNLDIRPVTNGFAVHGSYHARRV